jgi:hypothetical protein
MPKYIRLHYLIKLTAFAVFPLAALLCLQWPLRDWVQAYNRVANDAGQVVFAVYMAVALTAASMGSAHLAAQSRVPLSPRKYVWAYSACVLPWAAYLLWVSVKPAWAALRGLERFPESQSQGYFLIHVAVVLLAGLAAWFAAAPLRAWLREKPTGAL